MNDGDSDYKQVIHDLFQVAIFSLNRSLVHDMNYQILSVSDRASLRVVLDLLRVLDLHTSDVPF